VGAGCTSGEWRITVAPARRRCQLQAVENPSLQRSLSAPRRPSSGAQHRPGHLCSPESPLSGNLAGSFALAARKSPRFVQTSELGWLPSFGDQPHAHLCNAAFAVSPHGGFALDFPSSLHGQTSSAKVTWRRRKVVC